MYLQETFGKCFLAKIFLNITFYQNYEYFANNSNNVNIDIYF